MIRHLNRHEGGFLFTYISPRVVINADVPGWYLDGCELTQVAS